MLSTFKIRFENLLIKHWISWSCQYLLSSHKEFTEAFLNILFHYLLCRQKCIYMFLLLQVNGVIDRLVSRKVVTVRHGETKNDREWTQPNGFVSMLWHVMPLLAEHLLYVGPSILYLTAIFEKNVMRRWKLDHFP